jgi:hypothetical protein
MMVACKECSTIYNDADRSTICPHDWIMPPIDLMQKKLALELIDHDICFAHQPDGSTHRIQSITWNGMVTLHDMVGQFAPHLFVKASEKTK